MNTFECRNLQEKPYSLGLALESSSCYRSDKGFPALISESAASHCSCHSTSCNLRNEPMLLKLILLEANESYFIHSFHLIWLDMTWSRAARESWCQLAWPQLPGSAKQRSILSLYSPPAPWSEDLARAPCASKSLPVSKTNSKNQKRDMKRY